MAARAGILPIGEMDRHDVNGWFLCHYVGGPGLVPVEAWGVASF